LLHQQGDLSASVMVSSSSFFLIQTHKVFVEQEGRKLKENKEKQVQR